MPDSLEVVANRIAQLAVRNVRGLGRIGPGPVLTVVRDTTNGKLYVGFNTGVPPKVAQVFKDSIAAQKDRIGNSQVIVVRTDPKAADGGHSEINALNAAVLAREKALNRKLTELELHTFELHNVWLSGDGRKLTTAPRCEHCARMTRSVSVTQSMFVAEGGRVGEINVPQRAGIKQTPAAEPEESVIVEGPIVPSRGGGGGGEGLVGAAISGILSAAWVIAEPLIKKWFTEHYLKDKWAAEARAMVMNAITANLWRFNLLVAQSLQFIQKEKAAGRPVILHVCVDTDWINTDYGPAQISAEVSYYDLLFQGQTAVEWPVFQRRNWFVDWFGARVTTKRQAYDFPL